jgi:ATP-dependent RNA helicase DeaD
LPPAYLRQQLAARPAPEDVSDAPVFDKPGDKDPRTRERFEGGTWFKVSVGRKHKAEPRWLLPMLCKAGNVTKTAIGSIRIFDTESIFEVAAQKADAFARSIEKNGSGERGVTISAVDGPGERRSGPPPSQRRPPGPVERYDPNAPRPERADRKARYGSAGLRPDDLEAPASTGGWNPAGDEPRAPRPDFDKPRPPKVSKAPPSKDKGKPKWAGKPADGAPFAKKEKPAKKDHKPKRKPQV